MDEDEIDEAVADELANGWDVAHAILAPFVGFVVNVGMCLQFFHNEMHRRSVYYDRKRIAMREFAVEIERLGNG